MKRRILGTFCLIIVSILLLNFNTVSAKSSKNPYKVKILNLPYKITINYSNRKLYLYKKISYNKYSFVLSMKISYGKTDKIKLKPGQYYIGAKEKYLYLNNHKERCHYNNKLYTK